MERYHAEPGSAGRVIWNNLADQREMCLCGMPQGSARLAPLTGHTGEVTSVAFSPDGARLASSGADGMAILWDVATAQPIASFADEQWLARVAFSPDGQLLAAAGDSGAIMVYDLAPATLRQRACAIVRRGFSPEEWAQYLPGQPYRAGEPCPQ